jgi:NAD/NADP transhydrogenase alpha subunit
VASGLRVHLRLLHERQARVWDHCHTHGFVRAPLCNTCNTRHGGGWQPRHGRAAPSLRHGGSIAALFHAEGTPDVVAELLARGITAYSFEYFQDDDGTFPLMTATGEIAGQMAVVYAAYHLQSHLDGSGVSLAACTYAPAARVAVIGYGNAGRAATAAALALGAEVTVYTWRQAPGSEQRASTPRSSSR